MTKVRLDWLLVERGLVDSRERGQRLIMAGEVLVGDRVAERPGQLVQPDADIRIKTKLPYASRGGIKLAAALEAFDIPVEGAVCADVGASTGGFTDVLLQRGAARVIAIDVGYGQLDWKLRSDPRVTVLDRTNARTLTDLPRDPATGGPVLARVVTIDVSFISLTLILPAVARWLTGGGHVVALIKPQFEAGRERVGKGGVVRDPSVHADVLGSILRWAAENGWIVRGLIRSPIEGPAGNVEFLAWLTRSPLDGTQAIDLAAAIARVI
ncbi:MAG TPA: TlyA family RNA methyltransferase [Anaerolineae bacterium]|nr:TlyA family RNA methyltransferase [Anaerolineae bacterium]